MADSPPSSAQRITLFWQNAFRKASNRKLSMKNLTLPLARIKRLMKVEEDVRMVASEVPVLFSLVAEVFVEELTLRAWINTDESKRRILQRADISAAVKTSPMYDFLVYIVPSYDFGSVDLYSADMASPAVMLGYPAKTMNHNAY